MKVSKATLLILILVIAAYFLSSNVIYVKLKSLVRVVAQLHQAILQEGIEIKKLADEVVGKEKELDSVKKELDDVKKELVRLKAKP